MSNAPHNPHAAARVSAQPSQAKQALQQKLLESVRLLKEDVLRIAHDWQARSYPPMREQHLLEIRDTFLVALTALEQEFSAAADPAQVDGLLNALVGAQGMPAPLTRLQQAMADDSATMSLDEQRLLSETDRLSVELNGLRAQWHDYLAVGHSEAAPGASPKPSPTTIKTPQRAGETPPPGPTPTPFDDVEADELPPLSPVSPQPAHPAPPRPGVWEELGDLLRSLLPILLALLVISFVAFELLSQLPRTAVQPVVATSHPTRPVATSRPPPTSVPTLPVVSSQPPGSTQLSVNPPLLSLPCPATGEALLQLTNTGTVALDWAATIVSPSGTDPGILLDGEPSETGRLSPGEVFLISVTAQARQAQGTISIQYSGSPGSIQVPYSVGC